MQFLKTRYYQQQFYSAFTASKTFKDQSLAHKREFHLLHFLPYSIFMHIHTLTQTRIVKRTMRIALNTILRHPQYAIKYYV